MAEIVGYFYRTHDRNEYFEIDNIVLSKAHRQCSKYGKYGSTSRPFFVVPNISTSEGIIENWLTLKNYVLNNID